MNDDIHPPGSWRVAYAWALFGIGSICGAVGVWLAVAQTVTEIWP